MVTIESKTHFENWTRIFIPVCRNPSINEDETTETTDFRVCRDGRTSRGGTLDWSPVVVSL